MNTATAIDTEDAFAQSEWRRRVNLFLHVAVIAGIALRLVQYLWRRSFWHDEAYQVLNVMTLPYRQLVGSLPHAQSAPPLFLRTGPPLIGGRRCVRAPSRYNRLVRSRPSHVARPSRRIPHHTLDARAAGQSS